MQARIPPLRHLYQLCMAATLDDLALLDHQNGLRVAYGGQVYLLPTAMGDDDDRSSFDDDARAALYVHCDFGHAAEPASL